MTVQVQRYLVDDLVASEDPDTEVRADAGTVRFALGRDEYEIDLTETNLEKFRKKLEPYMKAGRRIAGKPQRRPSAARKRSTEVRQWARSRGLKISDRGRIPASVIAEYESAAGS